MNLRFLGGEKLKFEVGYLRRRDEAIDGFVELRIVVTTSTAAYDITMAR